VQVRFTQIKERVTADSLLGKAVSCGVSVVKCSSQRRYKPCTKGSKYFCGWPEQPALVNGFVTFLLDCTFKNDTAMSEK